MNLDHYQILAGILDYPTAGYPVRVKIAADHIRQNYPEAYEDLETFRTMLPQDNLGEMQELYTRSFDVQAITTLDTGYVLFGDDYKRGELLANLNREHHQVNNDCRGELADHLPNILRLLPLLEDPDLIDELVAMIVAPALRQMVAEFDPERIEKKNKSFKKHYKTLIDSPVERQVLYRHPLNAVYRVITRDFSIKEEETESPNRDDFLKSVETEMLIEDTATQ